MDCKCLDCSLEFSVDEATGKYTIRKVEQLCCPVCQSKVIKRGV
jgi:DNA-directed RNA polymerase subunit RPC12/RpoP